MSFQHDQVFTVSPDVLSQEVSNETVLLDLSSEQYFGLDEVGTRIWSLVNDGTTVTTIVDTLFAEYDVDRDQLERDVLELIEALLDAGLIRS